jgi:uncharacterized membrane protein YeaQ/YmgE (transglycosylase-associated protein family)
MERSRVMVTQALLFRILGLVGAVAAGVGLWRFTSRDWLGGVLCAVIVGAVTAVYVEGQRRVKGSGGRRRY